MRALRTLLDWRIVACLILCAACSACNDTDDVHVGLRASTFQCSGGLYAANRVALDCGSEVSVDVRSVAVTIVGPTTRKDIKGLRFDVVYPRDRFAYVAGSTSMVPNNFLTYGGGVCVASKCTAPAQNVGVCVSNACTAPAQNVGKACANDAACSLSCTSSAACDVPGVNMPILTASESLDPPANPMMPQIVNGRLSITINRTMPADGVGKNNGGPGQVLQFQLQAVSLTEPIDPTLIKFQNAAAVDPSNVVLPSVMFNNQLILWVE